MKLNMIMLTFLCAMSALAQSSSTSFRYEGKLSGPGLTGTLTNQSFRADIRRPDCLSQSLGLTTWASNSVTIVDGVFSVSPSFSASDVSTAMNPKGTFGTCPAGTYADRVLRLEWYDGSSWIPFAVPLTDAPRAALALNSLAIGGAAVNPNLVCTSGTVLQWDTANSRLNCAAIAATDVPGLDASKVVSGTLGSSVIPAFSNSDITGTISNARVTKIQNYNVSSTAPTTGQILKFSGSQWAPASDDTITNPMTISLDMGTNNITNATSLASTNVSTRNILLSDNSSNSITLRAPSSVTPYTLTWPSAVGSSGQVLTTSGSGTLSWSTPSTGLSTTDYATDVAGASSCSALQTSYWNTVADTWACQNIKVTGAGAFLTDGGNSLGASMTLGTVDSNTLSIVTGNSNRMFFTTTGKVGINTASPAATLDINGDLNMRGISTPSLAGTGQGKIIFDSATNKFKISENGGTYTNLISPAGSSYVEGGNSFAANSSLGLSSNFALGIRTNGANRIYITNGGDVGINTTLPLAKFDVNGTASFQNTISILGIASPSVSSAGSARLYFDSSTNLLKASVNGGAYQTLMTSNGSGQPILDGGNTVTAHASIGTNSNFNLNFRTNSTPRMTLDTNGSLGLGTSTPAARLHAVDSNADVTVRVENQSSLTAVYPRYEVMNYTGSGNGHSQLRFMSSHGSSASPTPNLAADILGEIAGYGNGNTGTVGHSNSGYIRFVASENFSASNRGTEIKFGVTPNAASSPVVAVTIENDSTLKMGPYAAIALSQISGSVESTLGLSSSGTQHTGKLWYLPDSVNKLRYHDGTSAKTIPSENTENVYSQKQTFDNKIQVGVGGSEVQKIVMCESTLTLSFGLPANQPTTLENTCLGAEVGMIPACALVNRNDTDVNLFSFMEVPVETTGKVKVRVFNHSAGTVNGTTFIFKCVLYK